MQRFWNSVPRNQRGGSFESGIKISITKHWPHNAGLCWRNWWSSCYNQTTKSKGIQKLSWCLFLCWPLCDLRFELSGSLWQQQLIPLLWCCCPRKMSWSSCLWKNMSTRKDHAVASWLLPCRWCCTLSIWCHACAIHWSTARWPCKGFLQLFLVTAANKNQYGIRAAIVKMVGTSKAIADKSSESSWSMCLAAQLLHKQRPGWYWVVF